MEEDIMLETNQIKQLIKNPTPRKRISIIKTIIIKEASMLYGARYISTPAQAAGLAKDLYQHADREILLIASLDSKCAPLSIEIVAVGNINSCIVSPREVFKHAIISNATQIIAFHNHISGICTPSSEAGKRATHHLHSRLTWPGITTQGFTYFTFQPPMR